MDVELIAIVLSDVIADVVAEASGIDVELAGIVLSTLTEDAVEDTSFFVEVGDASSEETEVVALGSSIGEVEAGTVVLLACRQGNGQRSRFPLCKKAWTSSNDEFCVKPGYHSGWMERPCVMAHVTPA